MQITLLLLLVAAVTQSFGDLLDGLEHDHHDHHDDLHDHHEEQLEEILDDHDLKSLDHDDSVPFSEDQYEEQLLNEISRFLPREEFSVATKDDDSSEVSLFTHLANPGRPKSFSVQEPVQQPLIVKQPIPEFGVPLKIIPPVQRQTNTELQEPSQEFGIPLQEIQAPQVEEHLIIKEEQPLLSAVEPFAIIPEEAFDFNSQETFGSSFEDLTNFLPHPEEEIVVIPSLPVTNLVVDTNPPAVQKVVVQTPPLLKKVTDLNPPAPKARIATLPTVKSSPLPRTEVQPNTLVVSVPDTPSVNVVSPASDSLSSPSLSLGPSHRDFDDFSDNSIGGQGRQLGTVRNEDVPKSSRAFDLLDGDYPRFGPFPPLPREFKCDDHEFDGYYADPEFNCQVFHVCHNNEILGTFLCPNGTLFNQQVFVCDWWFNVDCEVVDSYYYLNENIGKVPEKKDRFLELDDDDFDD